MLKTYGINNLDEVFVHGFLTIEGSKMSKSKGNFILADKALTFAHPDYYRYYLCSKLNTDISDIDFSVITEKSISEISVFSFEQR